MAKSKNYNFEKHSIFEIIEAIEEKGFTTEFRIEDDRNFRFAQVQNADVIVRMPFLDANDCISPSIMMEDMFAKHDKEENLKLYNYLTRKFGTKKDEAPKEVKDLEKIDQLQQKYLGKNYKGRIKTKKSLWPFK